jgi:arsenate reductase-like glutaredoxin family protein
VKTEVNAKKETHQLEKAMELVANASRLIAAKGKKVVDVNLKKESLSEEEIGKLMLGPTGNLRAPTLVKGKTVIVGFEEETYKSLLG